MTYPEVLLWQRLRGDATGARFRRQHPLGPYVTDFCCLALRLVVEIDGECHQGGGRSEADLRRDRFMTENGYRVIRIPAADVLAEPDAVAHAIAVLAKPLHPDAARRGPPPRAGEEL